MKRIDEVSNCSSYIVLNKKGEHIATVNYRYGSGGGVQCDVFNRGNLVHQKKASGYGYDKATAALSGAILTDTVWQIIAAMPNSPARKPVHDCSQPTSATLPHTNTATGQNAPAVSAVIGQTA